MGKQYIVGECRQLLELLKDLSADAVYEQWFHYYPDTPSDPESDASGMDDYDAYAEVMEQLLNGLAGQDIPDHLIHTLQHLRNHIGNDVLQELLDSRQVTQFIINERGYFLVELNTELA